MTTNIYDKSVRKLASDSRWSAEDADFVLYVDNTGFDKILSHSDIAMMFAGNGKLIQCWKDWLPKHDVQPIPPVSNGGSSIALCIVNLYQSEPVFEYGQNIKVKDAIFAGSGSIHAYTCWNANKNPCFAIESAKKADILSGGDVKYLDCANGGHNLENNATIDDVHKEIVKRGLVMYKNNNSAAIPVLEAAKENSKVKALVESIQGGSVIASAPCDAMYNEWPAEKITELHSVLKNLFPNIPS